MKHVPVAVVLDEASADAVNLGSVFELSPYFHARFVPSIELGKGPILDREVQGIIRIRPDFARPLHIGDAVVPIMAQGGEGDRTRTIQNYAEDAVGQWAARLNAEGEDYLCWSGRC
jgi:ABC-2 type transport system permease protein